MEMTNSGDLSIAKPREWPVVEDGTWEAEYTGFRPFKEDGQWGHKEGVRLLFKVTKGPFATNEVTFKGNFFQDNQSGKWIIGSKSKLAEAIRNVTGGQSLNKGHVGTKVFVTVVVNTSKSNGKRYSNVTAIIPIPKDYAPSSQPAQQQAPAQAAPANPPAQAAKPASQAPAQQTAPSKNDNLMDDLSDLSDLG